MKNNDKQIIKQAEEKVAALFDSGSPENLFYHSMEHTRKVVDRANEIAAHYELSEKDIITLNIGAWFHDVGHETVTTPVQPPVSTRLSSSRNSCLREILSVRPRAS